MLGENLRGGFCDVSCSCSFIFVVYFVAVFHFVVVVLHYVVVPHLSMFFIHICFTISSLTLPWTIAGFLHPFYSFNPAHRRVIRDTLIFNHSVCYLLTASATVLGGHFLATGAFYLMLIHRHFTCVLPGSQQFFLVVCRASY